MEKSVEINHTLRVSIVSYSESTQQLAKAIDSIEEAIKRANNNYFSDNPEIIVIDNSEDCRLNLHALNQCRRACGESPCRIELIQGHGNIGYGRAHNLTLKENTSGFHVFMNPDVVVEPHALINGLSFLSDNDVVGMVAPRVVDDSGELQYLCKRLPTIFDFLLRGLGATLINKYFIARNAYYEMRDISQDMPTIGVPIASGCFMLCRSESINKIGGFDPKYFLYFEDFDLSLRVRKLKKIAYLPSMQIVHSGGGAARKGARHLFYFSISAIKFFRKHGWRWFSQE